MYSYEPPHMAEQKQDDQLEHIYSSYVRIRDVALKTCQRRWTIWRSGERGSGISVLAARHDDDDDICIMRIQHLKKLKWLICSKSEQNHMRHCGLETNKIPRHTKSWLPSWMSFKILSIVITVRYFVGAIYPFRPIRAVEFL